jgi:hypothetical protein
VTPIRQGQLVCVHVACWEIIRWRTVDEVEPAEVVAVVAAREVILEGHDDRVQRAHAHERSIATRDYRANARPVGRHQNRWDKRRQANDQTELVYAVAWASAGATRGLPKPYSIPPWEPYDPWDLPQYDWNTFLRGFAAEYEAFVRDDTVRPWVELRTMACYQLAWTLMHDTIRRDRGLFNNPMVREHMEHVVKRTEWWRHIGRHRNVVRA